MRFSSTETVRPLPQVACYLVWSALLFGVSALPATAQTITVQNGGTLTVQNGGVWDLRGATVDLGGTGSTARVAETGGSRFTGGTLTATRDLKSPSQTNPAGLGIQISSGEDLGATNVTRGHAVQTALDGNESIARYYDLAPTVNGGLDATLTFHYHDAELNDLAESTLELFRSADGGSTWSEQGHDSRDASANTVTLSGIDALSRWTLASDSSPLPVELTSFKARADDVRVQLTWQTASETGNAGFDVERKQGEVAQWTKVGFVEGIGTTSEPHTYTFNDGDLPYEAKTLAYRLKQVDTDGSVTYSEEVEVSLDAPDRLVLRENFPNPFADRTTIRYALPESAEVRLIVYNALGQRVATLAEGKQEAGRHAATFEARALPSGIYFVRLRSGGATRTRKLTVVR